MTRNHAYKRLYPLRQGDLTMIVEAEWNRRLGRGFNSRRLHHERTDRLGRVNRCVPDGGDMGSTRRDKGYAAIRLSYGLNSAN